MSAVPASPSVVQVWVDERSRLARVDLPAAALVVIREDLATVLAREEHIKNPGDDSLYIPASGFSLGATITRPAGVTGRAPAGHSRRRTRPAGSRRGAVQRADVRPDCGQARGGGLSSPCDTTSAASARAAAGPNMRASPSTPRT